jgi:amino acid transporter
MTLGFSVLSLVLPLAINMFPRLSPWIDYAESGFLVVSFMVWVIVSVLGRSSDGTRWFSEVSNTSGHPIGWTFVLSIYTAMYGLYGADAIMHLVEETRDAARNAPVCYQLLRLARPRDTNARQESYDLFYPHCFNLYNARGSCTVILLSRLQ